MTQEFPLGPSRQTKALFAKAYSFQKRQLFTNICCISLCPILMVALAAGLGTAILTLIRRSNTLEEYLYCSNVPSMDALNIPYYNRSEDIIPTSPGAGVITGATLKTIKDLNMAYIASFGTSGPPGAALLTFTKPCVTWYGEDYPLTSVYQRPTNVSTIFVRDSSFMAQPLKGWLLNILENTSVPIATQVFSTQQQRVSAVWAADPSVDTSLIGSKPFRTSLTIPQILALNNSAAFTPANATTGILGTLPTRYFLDINSFLSAAPNTTVRPFLPVPYYNFTQSDPDAMDTLIGNAINEVAARIASVDKSALFGRNATATALLVNKLSSEALSVVPQAGIYFIKIDPAALNYSYILQVGTDVRFKSSSTFPSIGQRAAVQISFLTNGFLRNIRSALASTSITQGLRIFPQVGDNSINIPFGSLIGAILYPFGVSFLLPIFCIILVQEKEARILVMMNMNGLKSWAYYVSQYVVFYILFAFSTAFFLITGRLGQLTFFTNTQPAVYIILFFLWGHVQITLAFFFSNFFNRSRLALVIVFLLVLCSVVISLAIDQLFEDTSAPLAYFLWPPFAFYRGLSIINTRSFSSTEPAYRLSDVVPGNELFNVYIFMAWETIVYMLISIYMSYVLPSEFGVRKPWYFPVTDLIKYFKKKPETPVKKVESQVDPEEKQVQVKVDDLEDEDVKLERARVFQGNFDPQSPLIIKNMIKEYPGRFGSKPKLAVKGVTFAVEKGLVFGLLGPNGAGKTTLISILTGLYEATDGEAKLAGFDINTETSEVYKRIGICPQFDIFWDDLSIEEHLYFYARLKGIQKQHEKEAVEAAMKWVSLHEMSSYLTKQLSGGQKRRLSIAMALIGSPAVVFLDEPTTGLDPEVRRLIWDIINEAKKDRTIILTTHSMEEAEALCQRIGIMAKGCLRCLANPLRLKELYGSGFKLYMNTLADTTEKACEFIESVLPPEAKKIDSFATNTSYEFPANEGILSKAFEVVESKKQEVGILDWGIGQTTLEEVFIRLISEADASAEA